MADYQAFQVEVTGKIAHVQINRPEKRNAMNSAFWTEIIDIFEWIDRTDEIRVVVLGGAGEHFSSGIDAEVRYNIDILSRLHRRHSFSIHLYGHLVGCSSLIYPKLQFMRVIRYRDTVCMIRYIHTVCVIRNIKSMTMTWDIYTMAMWVPVRNYSMRMTIHKTRYIAD